MTTKTFRVTSEAQDLPWEGSFEELLETNDELGEFVTQKIDRMPVGDKVTFDFATEFAVERLR